MLECFLVGLFLVITPMMTIIGVWKWIAGGSYSNLIIIPIWLSLLGAIFTNLVFWLAPESGATAAKAIAGSAAQFALICFVIYRSDDPRFKKRFSRRQP